MTQSEIQAKEQSPSPRFPLPESLQNRISMKWMTLESLRILQERQRQSASLIPRVLLVTSMGSIEGELADISDHYDESLANSPFDMDLASATAHIRTQLWNVYASKDQDLQPTDTGALVHLTDVVLRSGHKRIRLRHFAVFASEVVGFGFVAPNTL